MLKLEVNILCHFSEKGHTIFHVNFLESIKEMYMCVSMKFKYEYKFKPCFTSKSDIM